MSRHLSSTPAGRSRPDWSVLAPADLHRGRVQRILLVGSMAVVLVSMFWGVYFAFHDAWWLTGSDVCMIAIGAWCGRDAWQGRFHRSGVLLMLAVMSILSMQALYLDAPTAASPRSVHLYFLPLSVLPMMLFRDSRAALRYGATGLCLGLLVVFASWPHGLSDLYQLPDELRVVGTWFNAAAATCILTVMLHVLQSDASPMSARELELRRALVQGQIVLHFQPQVNDQGCVVGAEALARWQHPKWGLVMPEEFIPLAEQTGLILPLGETVLRQACQQLLTWKDDPVLCRLNVSVNVSAAQLYQDSFVQQVLDIVAGLELRAGALRLELTESLLAHDIESVVAKMGTLKARGIGLSLDDFGTGYSSLSYLKRLPLDELKIDKSFVHDLLSSEHDVAIVKSVLALGHSMRLAVVAEGVETEAQWEVLRSLGCTLCQGHLFAPAMPLDRFESQVRTVNR